jgi:hypothetical protein
MATLRGSQKLTLCGHPALSLRRRAASREFARRAPADEAERAAI